MKLYGVIMAGGGGTRFWPLSRTKTPKQLLNLSGNGLMINETIDRITNVIDPENIFIVTNEAQKDKMKVSVEDRIPEDHILVEPSARNTAACIGYAAEVILNKYEDGIMCIFPADHYIKNPNEFTRILTKAIDAAGTQDKLVTIGIKPTYPATGYGYIKYNTEDSITAYPVEQFVEKPDYERARQFIEDSVYAWNSGIFVWKASTILKSFERFLPKVYLNLEKMAAAMDTEEEQQAIRNVYNRIPSISIDYGILERSDDVVVVLGDFGWNDVGSWDSLGALYEVDSAGNITKGEQINIATRNCICYSENRLIATIGIDNLIVVESDDAVLVCRKDQAQSVKEVVEQLKERGLEKYLL